MRLMVLVLSLLLGTAVSAQELIESAASPEPESEVLPGIRVEPVEYDFGDIFFGKDVEYSFTIYNTGDQPVSIINIRVDCGCSVDVERNTPIEPGSSRVL
nr:DUF1573 domain-containing protein [bacterium]